MCDGPPWLHGTMWSATPFAAIRIRLDHNGALVHSGIALEDHGDRSGVVSLLMEGFSHSGVAPPAV
jgi:hypothetical protein